MKVAVIPARGGSTRVPRKNVKDFAGRPMIEYPIAAALESGLFERVVVSTDSDAIAAVSRKAGAEVPFKRPPELAINSVNIAAVVHHAVTRLQEMVDQGVVTNADLVKTVQGEIELLRSMLAE